MQASFDRLLDQFVAAALARTLGREQAWRVDTAAAAGRVSFYRVLTLFLWPSSRRSG